MFDIRFIRDEPEVWSDEPGEEAMGLRGRVILGDFSEEFLALLHDWRREDYERHWREAAERMANGADRTVFFTSAFTFRWAMWRDGAEVYVQEHCIDAPNFPERFDPAELFAHIRDHVKGEPVSEWTIPFASITNFARRVAER